MIWAVQTNRQVKARIMWVWGSEDWGMWSLAESKQVRRNYPASFPAHMPPSMNRKVLFLHLSNSRKTFTPSAPPSSRAQTSLYSPISYSAKHFLKKVSDELSDFGLSPGKTINSWGLILRKSGEELKSVRTSGTNEKNKSQLDSCVEKQIWLFLGVFWHLEKHFFSFLLRGRWDHFFLLSMRLRPTVKLA